MSAPPHLTRRAALPRICAAATFAGTAWPGPGRGMPPPRPDGTTEAAPFPCRSRPGDVVGIVVEAGLRQAAPAGQVLTFGHAFRPGHLPSGSRLAARLGDGRGEAIAVQLDVHARHPDGSARFGTVSLALPPGGLAGGQRLGAMLGTSDDSGRSVAQPAAALDLAAALASRQAVVELQPAGRSGRTWRVDLLAELRQGLQRRGVQAWQSGPLAAQARVALPVPSWAVGDVASLRLVADVSACADGTLWVEIWFRNDAAMQPGGGPVQYAVRVLLDGQERLRADGVRQAQYTGWGRKLGSAGPGSGAAPTQPGLRFDAGYLADSGAVARYDTSIGADEALLSRFGAAAADAAWGTPLGVRGVFQQMPATGGRDDIGPATKAQAAWLATSDARAGAYAAGQAEAAGSVPWHLWDPKGGSAGTGGWMDTERWPLLWTDGRGGPPPGTLLQPIPTETGWTLDPAHQPDLAYVPYLLTGRRAFLDEVQAQASWNLFAQWPAQRGGAQARLVPGNQVRGAAWSLRQLNQAAWASADGSDCQRLFQAVAARNWSWVRSQLPAWTAQQGEAHGWIPGEYGTTAALPPWQQDYFASTAAEAARQGSADALEVLKWMSNFLVGRFLAAGKGFDPHDGAAYLIAIAPENRPDQPYKSWAEIEAATKARGMSNDGGWTKSEGDYAQLALASLATLVDLTGTPAVRQAHQWLATCGAPFTQPQDYARDPTFSIVPKGGERRRAGGARCTA